MTNSQILSRRAFILTTLSAPVIIAGCATQEINAPIPQAAPRPVGPPSKAELDAMYGPIQDDGIQIPAIAYEKLDPQHLRQRVTDPTGEQPGTVVVDTPGRFLYMVEPGGTAMRYGVSIGRDGFAWQGEGEIHWRQHWPHWKPPNEMVARQPELKKFSIENGGMEPGIKNPLGARALYIFQNNQDTLYRLHGTPEWKSIGKAASSGCVRMINQDVIDLYDRVPYHARIVVRQ